MDKDLKEELKNLARNAELRATESLLRWKYKREGKVQPKQHHIEFQSRVVTEQAHRMIRERGKALWQDLKEACGKKKTGGNHKK